MQRSATHPFECPARRSPSRAWVVALIAINLSWFAPITTADEFLGAVEVDAKSNYSHYKVYRKGPLRSLVFIRDNGDEALQSQMDMQQPHDLRIHYNRFMFASYALRPTPQKIAIIGLGGGSMVHFLKKHDPELNIDIVEIDPAIVSVAEQYFGVKSAANINIIVADGVTHLEKTGEKYDVIYMDAFLKPSAATDSSGVPLATRTAEFYQMIQKKLRPDGLVAFNLNPHSKVRDDIAAIRNAFPQVYIFELPRLLLLFARGYVVLASTQSMRETPQTLTAKLKDADRRFNTPYSFEQMVNRLEQ